MTDLEDQDLESLKILKDQLAALVTAKLPKGSTPQAGICRTYNLKSLEDVSR